MDEFGERIVLAAAGQGGEAPLQQVFDDPDVVVVSASISASSAMSSGPNRAGSRAGRCSSAVRVPQGDHLVRGQVDQPLDLDAQSLAVEGGLERWSTRGATALR